MRYRVSRGSCKWARYINRDIKSQASFTVKALKCLPNRLTPLYSKIHYKEENYLKVKTELLSRNGVRRLCEVVALTMYTTGYCTKVQEVRRHERSIYYGVPRLARLTCVRAARPESVTAPYISISSP